MIEHKQYVEVCSSLFEGGHMHVQERSGARGSFNWQKNWYPIQLVKNMDAKASPILFPRTCSDEPNCWALILLLGPAEMDDDEQEAGGV